MTYSSVMALAAANELAMWLHAERRGLVAEGVSQQERRLRRARQAARESGCRRRVRIRAPPASPRYGKGDYG